MYVGRVGTVGVCDETQMCGAFTWSLSQATLCTMLSWSQQPSPSTRSIFVGVLESNGCSSEDSYGWSDPGMALLKMRLAVRASTSRRGCTRVHSITSMYGDQHRLHGRGGWTRPAFRRVAAARAGASVSQKMHVD